MSTFQEPHHNQGFIPFAQPGYEAPTPHLATGTFQQMWQTRPARIPAKQGGHAKVAGVCEGIGVRYQIDPVLIRLFFVVTGVFGAGVAAYLIAWLCMPRYSVPVSPIEALWTPGHTKDRNHGWWLVIAFFMFSGVLSSGAEGIFGPAAAITYLCLLAMWWALHKKQPLPPRGLLTTEFTVSEDATMKNEDLYPQPQPDLSTITPVEGYYAPFAQQTPEAPHWDPLAQNQYNTWDVQVPPQKPQKKRHVWPWIVGGVVGTGVVMSALAGLFISNIDPIYFEDDPGIGDVNLIPTNDELLSSYTSGVGEMNLDFSHLTQLDQEQNIQITSGIGEVMVTLPDDVPVSLSCTAGVGTARCDVGDLTAHNADLEGPMLNLVVNSGIGDVNVEFADQND
ncbi:two-component system EsrSR regulator EsrI [Corynebacterium glutamicum]|uniref:two-component system EsrSR regulator EsrI n=1 Tax=Corynebacterium glutamicum TaxID=1718 RepID=UPI00072303EE|nr:two-component system EsrSR regulator EsrI [Corynebacterium glutamicum]ALP49380.1 hypothetical protein AC079_03695 [Corynebacterium glutamicum]